MQDSLNQFTAALTLAEQLQDEKAQAQLLGRIGAAMAELDRLPEAIATAERALALAQTLKERRLQGEQEILLAFAHADAGNAVTAAGYCRAAIATYQVLGDDGLAEKAQRLLAELEDVSASLSS